MQPTRQKFTEYLASYQFKQNDTEICKERLGFMA